MPKLALVAVVAAAGAAALSGACAQLEKPTQPCTKAEDCLPPFVCCTGGYYLSLNGFTGPTCSVRWECPDQYLPFLPEGAPCQRGGDAVNGDDCKAGTSCCAQSLTCETAEVCAAKPAVPAVPELAMSTSCLADSDCPTGTVCCGISYSDRAGTCRPIAACGAENGVTVPTVDGGVVDVPDAGMMTDYAAAICDEAYCGESGPRAPTAAERSRCLEYLRSPGYRADATCLDAIRATRPFCSYALRHRDGVDSATWAPVLPAGCHEPAPTNDPDAEAACRKLAACGLLGQTSELVCRIQLAGLGYDTLSRIHGVAQCTFDPPRMGWAPASPASRCTTSADCPVDFRCDVAGASHGLCTKGCSSDNDCRGGRCYDGFCVAQCSPVATERRAAEAACGARVELDAPFELVCVQRGNVTNATSGICAPYRDPATCGAAGTERPVVDGRAFPAGLRCASAPSGTVELFGRCTPPSRSAPDDCAAGVCVDGYQTCAEPCLVGDAATSCTPSQRCVSDYEGLGTIGGCFERCDGGAQCPNGLRCISTFVGSQVCMP
ncbi:hypothetical protein L6R52_21215 [Myxococcota bacterium]|nr:hypothetical protein [Myxococcota bacterium]